MMSLSLVETQPGAHVSAEEVFKIKIAKGYPIIIIAAGYIDYKQEFYSGP